MRKILIMGNSGAGKSTLARQLAADASLAHLDLDTLAWLEGESPRRAALADAGEAMGAFTAAHAGWVVEGCYADLLQLLCAEATELIFLNLPVALCIDNARQRTWEAHKYPSPQAQQANLAMLLEWIAQYPTRRDACSLQAHQRLYHAFKGDKIMYRSNARSW
jgi:adenylate kinase family enzyme